MHERVEREMSCGSWVRSIRRDCYLLLVQDRHCPFERPFPSLARLLGPDHEQHVALSVTLKSVRCVSASECAYCKSLLR
jgi:hypothetical protein